MDLKQKFKLLMNKQGSSVIKASPSSLSSLDLPYNQSNEEAVALEREAQILRSLATDRSDPLADQEVLESIEEIYFQNEGFDPSQYELEKLPEILDLNVINGDRQRIRRQLTVVSKQVFQLILQNQLSCTEELKRVGELEQELKSSIEICQSGRSQLHLAKRQFTTSSLGILANHRKRQIILSLLHSFNTIKTLQRTDVRLQELLSEEDYPGAIQLLLEGQKAAATYQHFKCISALSHKLQDTLEMAEEQLDVALSKVCRHFDEDHYEKLQTAYRLLGKSQIAMDQLHMHYTSAIHNAAFTIVHGYVELYSGGQTASNKNNATEGHFQKKQYQDLCKSITTDNFIPCLLDLCKALWEITRSYYKTMQWHINHDTSKKMTDDEPDFNRRYIKQKLEHGLARIWQDVQTKIRTYVLASDLSSFKFDDFLHVLDIVNKLMSIGEEFCGSESKDLQESLRKQSANYFRSYHQSRLEELRLFLENEVWEACPLRPNFSISQLHEFKFLHLHHINVNSNSKQNSPAPALPQDTPETDSNFIKYFHIGSPFDAPFDESQDEDILAMNGDDPSGYHTDESDDDIPEELKQDFVDENTGDKPQILRHSRSTTKGERTKSQTPLHPDAPILTNTTLTVLRLCGKYLQMMKLLKPIACDVVTYLSQLFDYYLFAVYQLFATEMNEVTWEQSFKLRATLKRISDHIICTEGMEESKGVDHKVPKPKLCPLVELSNEETLFGLPERVAATESLAFLAAQFELLRTHLELGQTNSTVPILHNFYQQSISVVKDIRWPVYASVAARAIDYMDVISRMSEVNWDVKDVMSQHSPYVDRLVRDLQIFSMRLDGVSKTIPISKEVYDVIWEHTLRNTNQAIVEGFSNARKCSQGGRALMQLDFTQFMSKVERITQVRPIPEKEYVENYVKAYYIPELQMEEWVQKNMQNTAQIVKNENQSFALDPGDFPALMSGLSGHLSSPGSSYRKQLKSVGPKLPQSTTSSNSMGKSNRSSSSQITKLLKQTVQLAAKKKPKSNDLITVDIGEALLKQKHLKNEKSKDGFKNACKPKLVEKALPQNMFMDSIGNVRYKGKQREVPKKPRLSLMKKVAVADRIARKEPVQINSVAETCVATNGCLETYNPVSYTQELQKAKQQIHTIRFQPYCDHKLSKKLDGFVINLLDCIVRYQANAYSRNPNKVNLRYVSGIKEVSKRLPADLNFSSPFKLIIIAPNLEFSTSEKSPMTIITKIIEIARNREILYVFSMNRTDLSKHLLHKPRSCVSVIGIMDYQGADTHEIYKQITGELPHLQEQYKIQLESAIQDVRNQQNRKISSGLDAPGDDAKNVTDGFDQITR